MTTIETKVAATQGGLAKRGVPESVIPGLGPILQQLFQMLISMITSGCAPTPAPVTLPHGSAPDATIPAPAKTAEEVTAVLHRPTIIDRWRLRAETMRTMGATDPEAMQYCTHVYLEVLAQGRTTTVPETAAMMDEIA